MISLYISLASAILVIGQFVYYRHRVSSLQVQANNAVALGLSVRARDEKIKALEANLSEKNEGEHDKDVKDAAGISTIAGAIGYLRSSGSGGSN